MELLLNTFFVIILSVLIYYFLRRNKPKESSPNITNDYCVITNPNKLKLLQELIHNDDRKIVGIDIEYNRGEKYLGKICLIQITLSNQKTFLVDSVVLDKSIVKNFLNTFLPNENIEKVFHSCSNDLEWIYDEFQIEIKNIFDTQEAEQIISKNNKKLGLDSLLNNYKLCKIEKVYKKFFQKSDWQKRPLTNDQLNYACQDSFYLIRLRDLMVDKMKDYKNFKENFMKRISKRFLNKEEKYSNKLLSYFNYSVVVNDPLNFETSKKVFLKIYQNIDEKAKSLDINTERLIPTKLIYKISATLPNNEQELIKIFIKENFKYDPELHKNILDFISELRQSNQNTIENDKAEGENGKNLKQKHRYDRAVKNFTCKKPIYENCKMLAPDGELLCFCDNKKMTWYVQKNLAEIQSIDPPVFRLKFEPNARGCSDLGNIPSHFYLKDRKNCCVVCGNEENYMRFHVVPTLYRQFFPNELKSHKSHDVVLLCFDCGERANRLYEDFKKKISEEYNVPLNTQSDVQIAVKKLKKIIHVAKILYSNYEEMPALKKGNMTNEIQEFLNDETNKNIFSEFYETVFGNSMNQLPELKKEIIGKIKEFKYKERNNEERKNLHGKLVIDKVKDFQSFIRNWRNYFISSLNPQFLPDAWNVDHQFYRTFGEFSKFKDADYPNKENNNMN